jgi:hypothetical protein
MRKRIIRRNKKTRTLGHERKGKCPGKDRAAHVDANPCSFDALRADPDSAFIAVGNIAVTADVDATCEMADRVKVRVAMDNRMWMVGVGLMGVQRRRDSR